jgi:hypothetical protein
MDGILAVLPARYRTTEFGAVKARHVNFRVEDVVRADPSEAIHPEELRPLVRRLFRIDQYVDLGGTLLHPMLHDIAGNFEGSPEADLVVKLLILLEKTLVSRQAIPSDYFFCIAGKKA